MTLAIYRPESLRIAAFADSQKDVWTFFKVGKRGGKLYRTMLIEGVKASINLAVSSPFILIPGVGAAIRNSITGPAVDYVARHAAKQIIRLRQIARGHRKPRFFSEEKHSELDLQQLVRIIRTSLHVDAIKARVPIPRVSFEQVARSLESLINTAIPDEQLQRKAA